jgi:hypothetical protein
LEALSKAEALCTFKSVEFCENVSALCLSLTASTVFWKWRVLYFGHKAIALAAATLAMAELRGLPLYMAAARGR